MNDYVKRRIREEAVYLRAELKNGTFMGQPVDWNDPDRALVAAFYAGHSKAYQERGQQVTTCGRDAAGCGRMGRGAECGRRDEGGRT